MWAKNSIVAMVEDSLSAQSKKSQPFAGKNKPKVSEGVEAASVYTWSKVCIWAVGENSLSFKINVLKGDCMRLVSVKAEYNIERHRMMHSTWRGLSLSWISGLPLVR
jgi:hypothetical protein